MLHNPSSDAFYLDDCKCEGETDAAVRVSGPDLDNEVWVPKSVLHDDSEVCGEGDEGRLAVKTWFARKQGWA